jgi:hypothetical protein
MRLAVGLEYCTQIGAWSAQKVLALGVYEVLHLDFLGRVA